MARFVWTPRAFASLAAAKPLILSVEDMPRDRVVMETFEQDGAEPLIAICSHPEARHRAANEAYKLWGLAACERLNARLGPMRDVRRGGQSLVIPVMKLATPMMLEDNPSPDAPLPYTEWRIDLWGGA